jgi:hypothetical protein
MLTRNFHQLEAEVQRHVAADQVAQGSHKTGFIRCLAGGENDPEFIEREYGVPLMTSRLAESIFKGLPPGEAPEFFAELPGVIQCNGKDLSTVGWQFLAAELRALLAVSAEAQAVVAPVIAGMDLLAEGKEWPASAADDAAVAVYVAAVLAADAASARAVYADAYVAAAAADAVYVASAAAAALGATDPILARRRQGNTLLRLISEAPITITQENL